MPSEGEVRRVDVAQPGGVGWGGFLAGVPDRVRGDVVACEEVGFEGVGELGKGGTSVGELELSEQLEMGVCELGGFEWDRGGRGGGIRLGEAGEAGRRNGQELVMDGNRRLCGRLCREEAARGRGGG